TIALLDENLHARRAVDSVVDSRDAAFAFGSSTARYKLRARSCIQNWRCALVKHASAGTSGPSAASTASASSSAMSALASAELARKAANAILQLSWLPGDAAPAVTAPSAGRSYAGQRHLCVNGCDRRACPATTPSTTAGAAAAPGPAAPAATRRGHVAAPSTAATLARPAGLCASGTRWSPRVGYEGSKC